MKNVTEIRLSSSNLSVHKKPNKWAINKMRSLILVPSLVSALLINSWISNANWVDHHNDKNKKSTEKSVIDDYIAQWECWYLFVKLSRDKNNVELKKEYDTKCDKTATPKKEIKK